MQVSLSSEIIFAVRPIGMFFVKIPLQQVHDTFANRFDLFELGSTFDGLDQDRWVVAKRNHNIVF